MKLHKLKQKIKYEEFYQLKESLSKFKNLVIADQKFIKLMDEILINEKYLKYNNGYLNKINRQSNFFISNLWKHEMYLKDNVLKNPNQFLKLNCILKYISKTCASVTTDKYTFQFLYYINSKEKRIVSFGSFIEINKHDLVEGFIRNGVYLATNNQINFYKNVEQYFNNFKLKEK